MQKEITNMFFMKNYTFWASWGVEITFVRISVKFPPWGVVLIEIRPILPQFIAVQRFLGRVPPPPPQNICFFCFLNRFFVVSRWGAPPPTPPGDFAPEKCELRQKNVFLGPCVYFFFFEPTKLGSGGLQSA